MNFSKIYPEDFVNGPGCRVTLFVSGCIHACKGCYNKTTWNPKSGQLFTKEVEDSVIELLNRDFIQGLSLSGGDPLYPDNLGPIADLIKRVHEECPGKDIWMWTGFELKELEEMRDHTQVDNDRYYTATMADVLVDGKFVQDLYDPSLRFRGSSNQIIHTLKVD